MRLILYSSEFMHAFLTLCCYNCIIIIIITIHMCSCVCVSAGAIIIDHVIIIIIIIIMHIDAGMYANVVMHDDGVWTCVLCVVITVACTAHMHTVNNALAHLSHMHTVYMLTRCACCFMLIIIIMRTHSVLHGFQLHIDIVHAPCVGHPYIYIYVHSAHVSVTAAHVYTDVQ